MKKLLILISITVLFSACSNQADEAQKEEQRNVVVTTERSEERTYHPWLEYTGTSYAFKEANLGTTLPGRVEKVHYKEGSFVRKGDLLVELSAELYAQALAEKNTLEKDFERVSRLKDKGSIPQQKLDHVKAKYEAAKARAEMMRKNSEIRAPFSGTIVDYLVQEGENFFFSPGLKAGYSHTSGIVQLMQLNKLKIKIDVNEKDLANIREGQLAEVVFDAYPDKKLTGEIAHIDPILSTKTHTAKAEITVTNPEGTFKPGMYAEVRVQLPETTSVFVPLNAIYRQPGTGNHYVFVVKDHTVSRKAIQKSYTIGNKMAVKGIDGGLDIVVHGKNKVKEGDKVTISND